MRVTLTNILKDKYEVIGEAQNGQEAVERYKELRPDIVTMDITMPVMDGLEATKQIISFDPEAKIIVCSAMGQQKIVVKAIENGAKDFIEIGRESCREREVNWVEDGRSGRKRSSKQ